MGLRIKCVNFTEAAHFIIRHARSARTPRIPINSKIGNKMVKEKIAELSSSGVYITIDIVERLKKNNCKWDEDESNRRHNELVDIAYHKAWIIN